jgi:hypothetical protein
VSRFTSPGDAGVIQPVSPKAPRWSEENERLLFSTVTGQANERISFLQWVWGVEKSAIYAFQGAEGAMPELMTVKD